MTAPPPAPFFCKAAGVVFPIDQIAHADFGDIESLRAPVALKDGTQLVALDIEALELAMQIKPSVLEGRRLAYARRAWWLHNVFAHPAMQILAALGAHRLAFRLHDSTVPKPLGAKPTLAKLSRPG